MKNKEKRVQMRCISRNQPFKPTLIIDRVDYGMQRPTIIEGPALSPIGQMLREVRERRGLPLEAVSDALMLTKSMIAAIEAGDWDRLPHYVYVKGYVKSYASFLGIDLSVIRSLHTHGEAAVRNDKAQILPIDDYRTKRKADQDIGHPETHQRGLRARLQMVCASVIMFLVGIALYPAPQPQSCLSTREDVISASGTLATSLRDAVLPHLPGLWR
jgi:transcriptional regulator with XRE-family HTH domain